MTTNDDMCLPNNFVAPHHLLHDDIVGVCMPVSAVKTKGEQPLSTAWQDLKYKMAGCSKLAKARAGSVLYPHGAGSFWKRKAFLQVLRKHNLIFFAEDCKLGFATMGLNLRLAVDASQILRTEAPMTIFGPQPNWYAQRVQSWEMGRHVITARFARALFSTNGCKGWRGFAMQKLLHTYALVSNMVDILRLPMFLALGNDGLFWIRAGSLSMGPLLPA